MPAPSSSSSPSPSPLLWDWDATGCEAAAGKRGKRGRHHGVGGSSSSAAAGGGEAARCQVEGCGAELGVYKEYYRKHRVCEPHTKCLLVRVAGVDRRFCQQCSRFHAPSEFDQQKRSCRRRLSDHNARRRKPQTDVFAFGSGTLPRSLFDDRQQISFTWDKAPPSHANTISNSSWTSDLQLSQVMDIGKGLPKAGAESGNIHLSKSSSSNAFPTLCHDTNELLPIKGADASETASKSDGALDVKRALSLLSASSWGLTDPGNQTSSIIRFTNSNQNSRLSSVPNEGNSNVPFQVDGQPLALEPQMFQFTMDAEFK
uniref:SBP-type domain-containing protein n=1 Tax=Leersia perrieri TaxID=77586 RepID=A0A0D9WSY1_9ORYZ